MIPNYVFALNILTNSSSPSAFTWPPTTFNVKLSCEVKDTPKKTITHLLADGEGHAEFDEFKSDFSLAGQRASQDALIKMQSLLLKTPELTERVLKIDIPINLATK